jgi:hypothetical protein
VKASRSTPTPGNGSCYAVSSNDNGDQPVRFFLFPVVARALPFARRRRRSLACRSRMYSNSSFQSPYKRQCLHDAPDVHQAYKKCLSANGEFDRATCTCKRNTTMHRFQLLLLCLTLQRFLSCARRVDDDVQHVCAVRCASDAEPADLRTRFTRRDERRLSIDCLFVSFCLLIY